MLAVLIPFFFFFFFFFFFSLSLTHTLSLSLSPSPSLEMSGVGVGSVTMDSSVKLVDDKPSLTADINQGVDITVWSQTGDFSAMGYIVDQLDSLIDEWFPGNRNQGVCCNRENFGNNAVLALCMPVLQQERSGVTLCSLHDLHLCLPCLIIIFVHIPAVNSVP